MSDTHRYAMNELTKKKAKAVRELKSAKFKSQIVRIDDNWAIQRADELNWEIHYQGKFFGYYGSLLSAFSALPSKMLNEEAKGTLADVQRSWRGILEKIRGMQAILE